MKERQKWHNSENSFFLPSEVFDLCLERGPLLVYVYLVHHKYQHRSDDDLSCAVISNAVGLCKKTVRQHLCILASQGLICLDTDRSHLSYELCPIWAKVPKRYGAAQLSMCGNGQQWITGEVFDAVLPLPNEVFQLGLTANDLLVYIYLQYQKGARSGQCWPSYATIGAAVSMTRKTVQKHVWSLIDKGFIQAESTSVRWKDGCIRNGNLLYTVVPISQVLKEREKEFLAQLKVAEAQRKWVQRQGTAEAKA